jgi:chromosome segregation ATPase
MADQAKFMEAAAAQREAENEVLASQQADTKAKLAAANKKLADVQQKLDGVNAEYEAKLVQAQADHAAALAAMEAEIKAVEDRRAKAEKALDTLRAKLG